MSIDELRVRWNLIWEAVAPGAAGGAVFESIVARYAETQRAYHNLEHLRDCLRWLDQVRDYLARVEETELALWFHDAIYDPRYSDNEARSAEWAEKALQEGGATAEAVERVGHLIRLTKHQRQGLAGDDALLCDIDLAILAAEPARFNAYNAAMRLEYSWVPEDTFRRERGRVLAGFLSRPHIYQSLYFRERLEEPARANLRRVLARYLT